MYKVVQSQDTEFIFLYGSFQKLENNGWVDKPIYIPEGTIVTNVRTTSDNITNMRVYFTVKETGIESWTNEPSELVENTPENQKLLSELKALRPQVDMIWDKMAKIRLNFKPVQFIQK